MAETDAPAWIDLFLIATLSLLIVAGIALTRAVSQIRALREQVRALTARSQALSEAGTARWVEPAAESTEPGDWVPRR